MIRKRSEHGLGHLLNPLDPNRDNRDWITHAYQILIEQPRLLLNGGGPPWLDLPALTRIAITSSEVARAFARYNDGRPWRDQIKPVTPSSTPTSTRSATRSVSTEPISG